jgi:hypothetical protein
LIDIRPYLVFGFIHLSYSFFVVPENLSRRSLFRFW